jgi:hypothetical protein
MGLRSLLWGAEKRTLLPWWPRRGRRGVKQAGVCLLLLWLTGSCLGGNAEAVQRAFPFSQGERLVFHVRWSIIPAGEAVLEILPQDTLDGVPSYHFAMAVKTYALIDLFYKVRDRVESHTDLGMTHSLLYKLRSDGKKRRDIVVRFDWQNRTAQYADFGSPRKPIPIPWGTFDPLSVFYAFRLHDLGKVKKIEIPVTDGKKCLMGSAKVVKREKIEAGGKTYEAFLVEPDLADLGGVFEKSRDAKLKVWVTADPHRIPVRIESQVMVGSFVAELDAADSTYHELNGLK